MKLIAEIKGEKIELYHMLSCKKCEAECCKKTDDLGIKSPCEYINQNMCSVYNDFEKRPMECWSYPFYGIKENGSFKIIAKKCIGNPQFMPFSSLDSGEKSSLEEFALEFKDAFMH